MSDSLPSVSVNSRLSHVSPIGSGAFGEVFVADDGLLHRKVAVKRYLLPASELKHVRKSLSLWAKLRHPFISQVLDLFVKSERLVLLQTYCSGGALAQRLEEKKLDLPAAVRYFLEVADAVHYLHRCQLLHRDLKLANVLLDADGHAILIDLDHCLPFSELGTRSEAASLVGTPIYMAPELIRGKATASVATEVYALGVMLFELLVGKLLSNEQDAHKALTESEERRFELSTVEYGNLADWNAILAKATHANADRRYQSVAALMHDVQHLMEGKPISARRITRSERFVRWARRHPVTAGLSAAALVTLIATAVLSSLFWNNARRTRIIADRNSRTLQNQIEESNAAKLELEKLIPEVEIGLKAAMQAEQAQDQATRLAKQIEQELAQEVQRTEQLRAQAQKSLEEAQAAAARLQAKQVERSTIDSELLSATSQNSAREYAAQFREAWQALQSRDWNRAQQLADLLPAEERGIEFSILRNAISNQLTAAVEVSLGFCRAHDDKLAMQKYFSRQQILRTAGQTARKISFPSSQALMNPGFVLQLSMDEPITGMSSEDSLLLSVNLSSSLTNIDRMGRIVALLPDGSIVVGRKVDRHVEIVAHTFNPRSFTATDKNLVLADIESLAKTGVPLELDPNQVSRGSSTSELVSAFRGPLVVTPQFALFENDQTMNMLHLLAKISHFEWDSQQFEIRWLGTLNVRPEALFEDLTFRLHVPYPRHISVGKNRQFLFGNLELRSDGRLSRLELPNAQSWWTSSCSDSAGNLWFNYHSEGKSPLLILQRESGREELKQVLPDIGSSIGLAMNAWCDPSHLYIGRRSSIDRLDLPITAESRPANWLTCSTVPGKRLTIEHFCIVAEDQVLLTLGGRAKEQVGFATIMLDRRQNGVWLCDHAIGPMAIAPESGKVVTYDIEGRLVTLTMNENAEIPTELAKSQEASGATDAPADLDR